MVRDRMFARLSIGALLGLALVSIVVTPILIYTICRIEVPSKHIAILTRKTGKDLENGEEIAPTDQHKGLQIEVLSEGRHFRNPWNWDWDVVPQVEIPQGKLGVRVRLYGEDLPYAEIIAWNENQKGIVPRILNPGRYPYNAWVVGTPRRADDNYAEHIELFDPVVIPAGFKGVVTNLSGALPEDPNVLMVESGKRGVQSETLDPGTYYVNPYIKRINLVDCRSQRFNLAEGGEMGFPSKDGFWVTLDGIIEFRVLPEESAKVFVTYNDQTNDQGPDAQVDEEIINKVILPNARAFCRLRGSDHSGKEFIEGETRIQFQMDFQKELEKTCESQGIEIIQALITRISPPQKIAEPVRKRQIAVQEEKRYQREILQQESEKNLAIEQEMVQRKQRLIESEREVVKMTTEAEQRQQVALIEAQQQLKVAELELQAAEDLAEAVLARGAADAKVIEFNNQAEAAGWQKSVMAFGGNGTEFARWVMLKKFAPAYRQMMINTADSPLMDIFEQFKAGGTATASQSTIPGTSQSPPTSPN